MKWRGKEGCVHNVVPCYFCFKLHPRGTVEERGGPIRKGYEPPVNGAILN